MIEMRKKEEICARNWMERNNSIFIKWTIWKLFAVRLIVASCQLIILHKHMRKTRMAHWLTSIRFYSIRFDSFLLELILFDVIRLD